MDYVASDEEAHDDLVRCNQLAMTHNLNKWAVIQSPGTQISEHSQIFVCLNGET